jgi:hypothetical protein
MRSFGTVQEAVDFIMSSERPEELEVCVSLLPSGTEKRVFSWDPDFRDPNECLHDEIPSLVAAILWPEPTTNASVSPTTRATVVFPRTTGKKSAKVGAVLLARARPSHEALALRVDAGP